MKITRLSIMSQHLHTREIDITEEQLAQLDNPNRTALIQNIVPHLSPADREFLMTGITDEEWDSMGLEEDE
jgi:hypothetical protein